MTMLNAIMRCKQILFYLAAIAGPLIALLLRVELERAYGELPPYVIFYPAVFIVAMLGGARPGLLATTTAAMLSIYFVLQPKGQFRIERAADAFGLLIFCAMGIGISVVAELYHRNRQKVATYQNEKAIQVERRAAEGRYRMLFNLIDEGFCTIEVLFDQYGKPHDWRYMEVNPSFERHIGLEHALGKTMRELVPNIETRWLDIYGKIAVTGEASRFVEFSQALNRWFDLYAFRVGEPVQHRVAVLFTDITKRKQAEEALLRSEKLASVGRMAVAIAHELNNPLEAVTNLLYITKEVEGIPEPARQYLETADAELRRMAHITRQSLGFYRESTTPALVSINAVLDSAVDLLKSKIKAKHAIVQKQLDADVKVSGIPGELRQVFANFLANSLDAIEERGTIKLRVSANQRHVRVTVADNGKGMNANLRKHVFDPFFTTKGSTGTGLGLWVSREIISKHGGIIQVHSKVQRGAVFSVLLTLPNESAPVDPPPGGLQ